MTTSLRLTLTIRNGTFNTVPANLLGATKLNTAVKSVLALIQNDSPLITKSVMKGLLRRATLNRTRNTKRAEVELGSELRAVTTGAIDALTNLIGADAIAGLAADDRRRQPLKNINRAIAKLDLCLDIEIDGKVLSRIERLDKAPQARVDIAWNGDLILRINRWNTELLIIEGRSDQHDRISIDMHRDPQRFNELMQTQAPFVRVNAGHGRINPSGLRILRHHSLDRLTHTDLPEELKLHFSGDDPATTPMESVLEEEKR